MKKLIVMFAFLVIFAQSVAAKTIINPINKVLSESNVNKEAVSYAFVDINKPSHFYKLNTDKPMHPASIQKLITIFPSFSTLGADYEFTTRLYVNNNGDMFLKLGADPYFSAKDLKELLRAARKQNITKIKSFYIDDSILDGNEWGEGWQWDDELNPLMPKFSAYNIDRNLLGITISPTTKGSPADISTDIFYPTTFVNNVLTGSDDKIILSRKNYISPDTIDVAGVVSKDYNVAIPVNYPRRYFVFRLEDTLRSLGYSYYGDFKRLKLPSGARLVAEIKHPMALAKTDILVNSNNMVAETVFKLAGGKFSNETGSFSAAHDMFSDYCTKLGINASDVKIVDGSGVSKNNLVTAEFISDFLLRSAAKYDYNKFKTSLATAGEGTMHARMLYLKDKIRVKTGTLSDISSIAGFLETQKGTVYAFCIMNNDLKMNNNDKKFVEEYIIREVFNKL